MATEAAEANRSTGTIGAVGYDVAWLDRGPKSADALSQTFGEVQ